MACPLGALAFVFTRAGFELPAPPTLPVASHLSRQLSSFFFRFLRAGAAAAAPWASKGEEGAAAADCQRA